MLDRETKLKARIPEKNRCEISRKIWLVTFGRKTVSAIARTRAREMTSRPRTSVIFPTRTTIASGIYYSRVISRLVKPFLRSCDDGLKSKIALIARY